MSKVGMSDRPVVATRLRLVWDDSRSLKVYHVVIATIAVWIKFAMMAIHWRLESIWLR
jgi:hypothetical protein